MHYSSHYSTRSDGCVSKIECVLPQPLRQHCILSLFLSIILVVAGCSFFIPLNTWAEEFVYPFVVSKPANGLITSTPAGIDCGPESITATCSAQFPDGTLVTLVAQADQGFKFAGWIDLDGHSGTCNENPTCQLIARQPSSPSQIRGIKANWTEVPVTQFEKDVIIDVRKGECVSQDAIYHSILFKHPNYEIDYSRNGRGYETVPIVVGNCFAMGGGVTVTFDDKIDSGGWLVSNIKVCDYNYNKPSYPNNYPSNPINPGYCRTASGWLGSTIEVCDYNNPSYPTGYPLNPVNPNYCGLGINGAEITGWYHYKHILHVKPIVTQKFTLTVNKTGTGKGTVTSSSESGISCGSDCTEDYTVDSSIQLTAVADAGYVFRGWSGSCSGTDSSVTVTMDSAKTCTANFVSEYPLSVTKTGSGTVTNLSGISCGTGGTNCSATYSVNSTVELNAKADSGYKFTGWTGDCVGTSQLIQVKMDASKNCVAHFRTTNPAPACSVASDGLVACYPFNGNAKDGSGNNRDGTADKVIPSSDRHGNTNSSYLFDGSSSVIVKNNWDTRHTGEISHSFWFKPATDLDASSPRQNLVVSWGVLQSYYVGSSQLWFQWFGVSGLVFEIWDNKAETTLPKFYSIPITFAKDTWHHVVIQAKEYEPAKITIDGITHSLEVPEFLLADPAPEPESLKLGIGAEIQRFHFNGSMDDVHIYNRVLTAEEVNLLAEISPAPVVKHSLSVTNLSKSLGTVTSDPVGINCGSDCSESYVAGTQVTLTATRNPNNFMGWGGKCSGVTGNICVVTMNQAQDVTANFAPIYPFVISRPTGGTITSDPEGINCGTGGTDCSELFLHNTSVTLTAKADPGFVFTGWTDLGGHIGTCKENPICQLTVRNPDYPSQIRGIKASFVPVYSLSVTKAGNGAGSIVSEPEGINCGNSCSHNYPIHKEILLTATADEGYSFKGWTGDCIGNDNPFTIKMDTAKNCSATFCGGGCPIYVPPAPGWCKDGNIISPVRDQCSCLGPPSCDRTISKSVPLSFSISNARDSEYATPVTVISIPEGINCDNDCTENYEPNTEVELTATPIEGFEASQWTVEWSGATGCAGTDTSVRVKMDEAKSCHATFKFIPYHTEFWEGEAPNYCGFSMNMYGNFETFSGSSYHCTPDDYMRYCDFGSSKGDRYPISCDFPRRSLTITNILHGVVTSEPTGINCGTKCAEHYTVNNDIKLSTTADQGYSFKEWTGGCVGSDNPLTVKMDVDKNCSATFVKTECLSSPSTCEQKLLTIQKVGEGTVTADGINCGSDCQQAYNLNTEVKLTATPADGYQFVNWSGDCTSDVVKMDSTKNCTATFQNEKEPPYIQNATDFARKICGYVDENGQIQLPENSNIERTSSPNFSIKNLGTLTILIVDKGSTLDLHSVGNQLKIGAICNYGTVIFGHMTSGTGDYRKTILYSLLFVNFSDGLIIADDGKLDTTTSIGDKNGRHISVVSNSVDYRDYWRPTTNVDSAVFDYHYGAFINLGKIQAGKGLTENGTVGNGGNTSFNVIHFFNASGAEIHGGNGSETAGNGGSVIITANNRFVLDDNSNPTPGHVIIEPSSVIHGGSGGNQGKTGDVTLTRSGVNVINGNYQGNSIYIDPNISFIGKDTTLIAKQDIVIFGGDNWELTMSGLNKEAFSAGRKIILATGQGGKIDLRGNTADIFKAGAQVEIYTDNLLLDDGVTLEQLVSDIDGKKPEIIQRGSKIIYHATLSGMSQITDKANSTVPVSLELSNAGPKPDSYNISVTNANGSIVGNVPAIMTLEAFKHTDLNFNVTLPVSGSDLIIVTATSQADPTVVATAQIQVVVEGEKVIDPPPVEVGKYTTHGTLKDNAGNPLAGVTVQVGDKTVTTDAAGNWQVEGLTEGDYTVKGALDNFTCLSDVALGNEMYQQEVVCKQISSLKVSAKPTPFNAMYQGGKLSYLITATNGSDKTATGVVINNLNLPKDVEVLGLKALDGGECDVTSVSCVLPDLAPGSSARVQLELGNLAAGQFHHNIALNATGFPTDQVSTWKPVKPYLSTSIACTPNPVVMLSELHCTATAELSSFAPAPTATGVKLQFTPSAGTELKAATTTHGQCELQDGKAICTINDLSIVDATQISKAAVELDLKLMDAGLLVLTSETKLTAENYAEHSAKGRTNIMIPKDFKAGLVLAIDTTYSMNKFINGVIKGLEQFLQNSLKDPTTAPLTVLIEFKDDVRIVTPPTRDLNAVLTALRGLKVGGGGKCPEASVEAFNLGADYLADNGTLSIVTNAPPYPDANVEALKQRVTDMTGKGAKVFILYEPECEVTSETNQDLNGVGTDSLPTTP